MTRVLAIGALLLALTGCGTVGNFTRERVSDATPYGGVAIALDWARTRPRIPDTLLYSDSLATANVALSAVGDTLTLPITLSLTAWRTCDLALHYDNTPPPSNAWREFWFSNPINEYPFPQKAPEEGLPKTTEQPVHQEP